MALAHDLTEFLTSPALGKPLWMWLSFTALVLLLLALDLGILNRKNRVISVRHSLGLSAFYISLGLIYGVGVWFTLGAESGMNYLTGFAVEKALAIDNIFVIAMIFSFFAVPEKYQHRVLFWGILGVIILRAMMIALGAAIISEFAWVLYVFAVFLIATGIKMLFAGDQSQIGRAHV